MRCCWGLRFSSLSSRYERGNDSSCASIIRPPSSTFHRSGIVRVHRCRANRAHPAPVGGYHEKLKWTVVAHVQRFAGEPVDVERVGELTGALALPTRRANELPVAAKEAYFVRSAIHESNSSIAEARRAEHTMQLIHTFTFLRANRDRRNSRPPTRCTRTGTERRGNVRIFVGMTAYKEKSAEVSVRLVRRPRRLHVNGDQ